MAKLNQTFDATQVEPTNPLDPIPAGDYPMIISESEMKATKSGSGEYLQLTLEVIDGQYKGRKVWDRLNLVNPNATAVSIAEATLSAICHAVGVERVDDSEQLHDRPLMGKVKFVPADGSYDAKNEMAGYKPMPGAPAPARKAAPAASPSTGATPPWKKAG